ncbi:hypothetical protein [Streptomyces mirabilis]|uniref:hypothetical protein n=1 Tax=Streptomyces mirabilis TaxID=68239 RepID=UPI003676B8D3
MGHTLIGAIGDHVVLDFDALELTGPLLAPQPVAPGALRLPEPSRSPRPSHTPAPLDIDEGAETENFGSGGHCRMAMQYLL